MTASEKIKEISIHLNDVHDLFVVPSGDPFSEHILFAPGIEFIKAKIKPGDFKRSTMVRTTIFLPRENIEPDLLRKTKAALYRYCQFQLQQNTATMKVLRGQAFKALIAGFLFLTLRLLFSHLFAGLTFIPDLINTLLSDGFDIAFWVILWRPVDFFLFDLPAHRKEDQIYQKILTMELVIAAEN